MSHLMALIITWFTLVAGSPVFISGPGNHSVTGDKPVHSRFIFQCQLESGIDSCRTTVAEPLPAAPSIVQRQNLRGVLLVSQIRAETIPTGEIVSAPVVSQETIANLTIRTFNPILSGIKSASRGVASIRSASAGQLTSLANHALHYPAPVAPAVESGDVTVSQDDGHSYWQYYLDCDQWGVVFQSVPQPRAKPADSFFSSRFSIDSIRTLAFGMMDQLQVQGMSMQQQGRVIVEYIANCLGSVSSDRIRR